MDMILSLFFRERSASSRDCYKQRAGQIGASIKIRARQPQLLGRAVNVSATMYPAQGEYVRRATAP
jgi:hypothetical protein